ncbi:DUF1540 domain-containing protein [Tissierella creatinophila]|uniref:DUF1540 domain-containing protein n=1 Tax=Tissierella creatinophila DSM 6911 TaxID=1123403 RepID=A0A1U7M676_TISCR|nr:DUF1540 domain-containing protein [Tissierella creatinophila]OLS02807.1 hypothetical protein TICRE_12240 [Tissierella creatinophila DSM 6911]
MHNKDEVIEGVKCIVNNCHYNSEGNKCVAGKIEIAPRNANSSEETDCNTFKSIETMN